LQAENASLREEVQSLHDVGEIVSHSRAIRQALARASRAVPTDAVVLLLGESGTSDELLARALTLSAESTLRLEGSAGVGFAGSATPAASSSPLRSLDEVERDHIREVLERCGWRVNGEGNAAEVLGLHPNTLRFRMKRLGITRPRAAVAASSLRRG
jgi:transcriptional regulator with GAF, ATPase, and Fis domain